MASFVLDLAHGDHVIFLDVVAGKSGTWTMTAVPRLPGDVRDQGGIARLIHFPHRVRFFRLGPNVGIEAEDIDARTLNCPANVAIQKWLDEGGGNGSGKFLL